MTTPVDSPRARLVSLLRARSEAGQPMPWETRERRIAGVPRSGSTGRWYSGITPWLLWAEAGEAGYVAAVWHTARSAEEDGIDPPAGREGVRVGSALLFAADQLGVETPTMHAEADDAIARVSDLASFVGVPIRPGRNPDYTHQTGVIHLPAEHDFDEPAARAAALLELLVAWTRDENRLDRNDDDLEPWVIALGGAMLAAAFRVPALPPQRPDWAAALAGDGLVLVEAIGRAEEAVRYLLDLASPALRAELDRLDAGIDGPRPKGAGHAIDHVTSLGQALQIDEDELRDEAGEETERHEPLVLAEAAGDALRTFLQHFSHDEPPGRKHPPLCAWLAGGPGTGRNQVVAALNALFRTGGTDLSGTLVAAEGGTDLLAMIERVWSDEALRVLPCAMPSRVRVSHDRAIPTACLQALHIAYGLSPHLWVARLEHRLLRSGEYAKFVEAFEARAGRPWRGDAHRNPAAHREAMIHALGGADAGARRRVQHYEKTRESASWQALSDEAEWSLYHLKPGETEPSKKPLDDAEARRVLFVVDLASALDSEDAAAIGWTRRALAGVPARMAELATPAHRPFWFLLSPNVPLKDLSELVRWKSDVRKRQLAVDLDQNPVTAAVGTDLLGKDPAGCGPIYQVYARHRDDLHKLATLEGMPLPAPRDRDALLATFPFLPGTLPVAQAVIDTFAGDAEAVPLQTLVRKALDEQYYGPPDRFVPLDVLLEPMAPLLLESSGPAVASARIFVGSAAVAVATRRLAFPHESVLQTVRWANRIRGFPCTAQNLVTLMLVRVDRPLTEMIAEVEQTLDELIRRGNVKRVDGPQRIRWVRGM